jgi:acetolactate synthase-1/2/3 large subunit
MAIAAGLSYCETKSNVICTIGDQSFINAIQALVFVSQTRSHIVYVVCNNGKSISLTKQAISQSMVTFNNGQSNFLENVPNLSYANLADAFGLKTYQIKCDPGVIKPSDLQTKLSRALKKAVNFNGPSLIELILPSEQDAWEGIWNTKGNEKMKLLENTKI